MNKFLIVFAVFVGLTFGLPLEGKAREELREQMKNQLKGLKSEVIEALAEFQSQNLILYVKKMNDEIEALDRHINFFDKPESRTYGWEDFFKTYLARLIKDTHKLIESPEPEETLKAGAVYLSAVLSEETSKQILEAVKVLIAKENYIRRKPKDAREEYSMRFEVFNTALFTELREKEKHLAEHVASYALPVPASYQKLAQAVQEKIQLLKEETGSEAKAEKFQRKLDSFVQLTHELNGFMPINSEEKVQKVFDSAKIHHESAEQLEKFVGQKIVSAN